MSDSKQIRLSDIADRLDLAKITVSKALNDHPDIASSTKEKVKKTARKMGYVPNLIAKSLSSGETRTLGVVIPEIAHGFFGQVVSGIHHQAEEEGYDIILTISEEDAAREAKHIETLLGMRVDGLLVSVCEDESEREVYDLVSNRNVPLVFFDRALSGTGFSSVTIDDRGAARRLVEHMVDQGLREIGHLAGNLNIEIARRRMQGYKDALEARDIQLREDWITEGGFDESSGYQSAQKLLARGDLPEAIFAVNFPVALGFYDALWERDPELVDETSVAVFGAGEANLLFQQRNVVAGINQFPRKMGRRATSMLVDHINNDGLDGQDEIIETELITAKTVKHIPYVDGIEASAD